MNFKEDDMLWEIVRNQRTGPLWTKTGEKVWNKMNDELWGAADESYWLRWEVYESFKPIEDPPF